MQDACCYIPKGGGVLVVKDVVALVVAVVELPVGAEVVGTVKDLKGAFRLISLHRRESRNTNNNNSHCCTMFFGC